MDIKKRIARKLRELDVPIHLKGFRYLVECVNICYYDESFLTVEALYSKVGKMCNDSYSAVERAMRYAIKQSKLNLGTLKFIVEIIYQLKMEE